MCSFFNCALTVGRGYYSEMVMISQLVAQAVPPVNSVLPTSVLLPECG